MTVTVKKRGHLWSIKAKDASGFTVMYVDTWEEAMRIADKVSKSDNPMVLLEIGWLRSQGRLLDSTFTV